MYYIFLKDKIEKVDVDEENLHHHINGLLISRL
jgi:hypothetical protein